MTGLVVGAVLLAVVAVILLGSALYLGRIKITITLLNHGLKKGDIIEVTVPSGSTAYGAGQFKITKVIDRNTVQVRRSHRKVKP